MKKIDRETILKLVGQWATGELTVRQVHERAEELWDSLEVDEPTPQEDPNSITLEVLSQLDILNHQLITPEDIPVIVEFLETPSGGEVAAWDRWTAYWDNLDLDARIESLKDDPYYSAYPLPERGYDKSRVN